MVSLQTTLSPKERSFFISSTTNTVIDPSKKRKRDDQFHDAKDENYNPSKELKIWCTTSSATHVELQLEDAPLPPDWQRCLDIKSGRITFYNTRTQNRTSTDPRRKSPPRLSLDLGLDLNLSCKSETHDRQEEKMELFEDGTHFARSRASSTGADDRAMMAAICTRCHILVMMCRTSPLCPNCKFLHPPTLPDAKQLLSYGK